MTEIVIRWPNHEYEPNYLLRNYWMDEVFYSNQEDDDPDQVFDQILILPPAEIQNWFDENNIVFQYAYMIEWYVPPPFYSRKDEGWWIRTGIIITFDRLGDAVNFKLRWGGDEKEFKEL